MIKVKELLDRDFTEKEKKAITDWLIQEESEREEQWIIVKAYIKELLEANKKEKPQLDEPHLLEICETYDTLHDEDEDPMTTDIYSVVKDLYSLFLDGIGNTYSLFLVDPVELLEYEISPYTLKEFPEEEILGEIIFELTWSGYNLRTVRKNIADTDKELEEAHEKFEKYTLEELEEMGEVVTADGLFEKYGFKQTEEEKKAEQEKIEKGFEIQKEMTDTMRKKAKKYLEEAIEKGEF